MTTSSAIKLFVDAGCVKIDKISINNNCLSIFMFELLLLVVTCLIFGEEDLKGDPSG
jgi:hypothetical protein